MHLAVKFTTRIRPFKRWPAGTPYTTGCIFPPQTIWVYSNHDKRPLSSHTSLVFPPLRAAAMLQVGRCMNTCLCIKRRPRGMGNAWIATNIWSDFRSIPEMICKIAIVIISVIDFANHNHTDYLTSQKISRNTIYKIRPITKSSVH